MVFKYLVRTPNGSTILVSSLDGHEDCVVLDDKVVEPRVPFCERVNGSWRINKEAFRRAQREGHLKALSRLELVELIQSELLPRIEALEAWRKSLEQS